MVNCTRTSSVTQGGCGITLPDGEFTDGVLTLQSSELVSEESYTFEASLGFPLETAFGHDNEGSREL